MSEAKEAIIRDDESEGDDTEELYQSVFTKTEETSPFSGEQHFLLQKFDEIYGAVSFHLI